MEGQKQTGPRGQVLKAPLAGTLKHSGKTDTCPPYLPYLLEVPTSCQHPGSILVYGIGKTGNEVRQVPAGWRGGAAIKPASDRSNPVSQHTYLHQVSVDVGTYVGRYWWCVVGNLTRPHAIETAFTNA